MLKKEDFRYRKICAGRFCGYGKKSYVPYFHHSAAEIQLFLYGSGRYFIKDTTYRIGRNSLLVVHHNEIHRYLPHPGKKIERLNLVFTPYFIRTRPIIKNIVDKKLAGFYHVVLPEKEATIVRFLMENIINELTSKDEYWEESSLDSLEKILIIVDRVKDKKQTEKTASSLIKRIIDYIDIHFKDGIDLRQLSDRFNRSIFTLSRDFKKTTGMGFKEYLVNRKILEAKGLLETSQMKIESISRNCGFSDLSTFNKAFKRLTGLTPAMYRKIRNF